MVLNKVLRMVTYWEQHADCGRRVFRLLLTTPPATCGMHCASPCPSSITHLIMCSREYTYRWSARIYMQQTQGCGFSVSDCVHALNLMFFYLPELYLSLIYNGHGRLLRVQMPTTAVARCSFRDIRHPSRSRPNSGAMRPGMAV